MNSGDKNMKNDLKTIEGEIPSFICDSGQELNFTVYDRNGDLLRLNGCIIKWTLTNIGQKDMPLIVKDNKEIGGIEIIGEGEFRVILDGEDTKDLLSNKYEQEPIIIQLNGKKVRPNFGYINIRRGSMYQ